MNITKRTAVLACHLMHHLTTLIRMASHLVNNRNLKFHDIKWELFAWMKFQHVISHVRRQCNKHGISSLCTPRLEQKLDEHPLTHDQCQNPWRKGMLGNA